MVNFKKLVESVLLLEGTFTNDYGTISSAPSGDLNGLYTFFKSTFNIAAWPDFSQFINGMHEAFIRSSAESIESYINVFPLCDFIFYYCEVSTPTLEPNKLSLHPIFPATVTSFENACKTLNPGTNNEPFYGYGVVSGKGKDIKRKLEKKLAKENIGKVIINSPTFSGYSIKQTMYQLLELRKKARSKFFKTAAPDDKQFINNILLAPEKKILDLPDPRLKKLYERTTLEEVVNVARAMHGFYDMEYKSANPTKTAVDKTQFMNFINNTPVLSGGFAFTATPPIAPSISSLADPKGGYIIKNIIQLGDKPQQAGDLIQALQTFGNFISEGEPTDWAGIASGIGQIGQGLKSLGGPTMDKR
jgi:hypothetical protein